MDVSVLVAILSPCLGVLLKGVNAAAEEIGADLYAPDANEAVQTANAHPTRKATVDQQTVGRSRRVRKAAARTKPAQVSREIDIESDATREIA